MKIAGNATQHKCQTGIIGNCSYIAHIDKMASVVWLCWPHFDSSFVFGDPIDDEKGGTFSITPSHLIESDQYYLTDTNTLCTEFLCTDGRFGIIDFAPRFFQNDRSFMPQMLFRKEKKTFIHTWVSKKIQCFRIGKNVFLKAG